MPSLKGSIVRRFGSSIVKAISIIKNHPSNHPTIQPSNHPTIQLSNLKEGVFLPELLISFVIIVILITMLVSLSGSLFTTRSSRLQTIAAKIATKEMEKLRNTDFASLPPTCPPGICITDPDLDKLPQGRASRTMTDYENPGNPQTVSTQIMHVTVTVEWTEGVPKRVYLSTLIYQYGL